MKNDRKMEFADLSSVEPEQVERLWEPYIPYSMVTIIEGDPGIGKSYLTGHLASVVSTGGKLPDGKHVPREKVLWLSAEDDPAYTMRPRIDAMDGEPARIRFMSNYAAFDDSGLTALRQEVRRSKPGLIIIDPLYAFVPGDTDAFRPNEIRALLAQLAAIAQKSGAAMIVVRHLRKTRGVKALYQGAGSIDVIAAARSAMVVGVHPEDEDLRVLVHLKHNIAPKGTSWQYRLREAKAGQLPYLTWEGTSELTADDLQEGPSRESRSALEEAEEFLKAALAKGPKPATKVYAEGERQSHSKRSIERAKKSLNVVSEKKASGWIWSLTVRKPAEAPSND